MNAGSPDKDNLSGAAARRGKSTVGTGVAVGLAVVLLLVGIGGGYFIGKEYAPAASSGSSSYTITETGSSLIYPYLNVIGPAFTKLYPNVALSPVSSGSGTGISSAEQSLVDIGGTDAYLLPATASQYGLINVPIAISSQLAFYNLPGVTTHLNLNGSILAMIYAGAITHWNDPLIQAANPGVALPSNAIVPIHRSDGSGDTFMWTSLCYMSWKGWPGSYGTTYSWVAGQPGYSGNSGMVTGLQSTPYGIAYIGVSYLSEAQTAGEQYAALGDQAANVNGTVSASGAGQQNYILPTNGNVSMDANLGLLNLQPPSVAVSLILGGVAGATNLVKGSGGTMPTSLYPTPYPDTNLEYTLIHTSPKNPSDQKWVVAFLEWAVSYGNLASYMSGVHFLPLTAAVVGYDMQALQSVTVSN